MKIIDKNTDFYDYLQNVYFDDSITFDRTDSFVVTKEIMCSHLRRRTRTFSRLTNGSNEFVLLQICNTFWLFLVTITKFDELDRPVDYKIELIGTWKNYNKQRVLITFDIIEVGFSIFRNYFVHDRVDVIVNAIDTNDYKIYSSINQHIVYRGDYKYKEEKNIPLLKACGIANCIDPLDVYLAFEEYFLLEKTASERRDPVGTTDVDRLESHGFDKKTSFRGKR